MFTYIMDCQALKGIPRRIDECVVGIDEFVVAEPYRVIFARILEELIDKAVATGVQMV